MTPQKHIYMGRWIDKKRIHQTRHSLTHFLIWKWIIMTPVLYVFFTSLAIAIAAGCNCAHGIIFKGLLLDIVSSWKDPERKYRYPPGPKPLPIIGNMHQLPPGQLGKWAQEAAKQYGEMFTIKIGGQRWVFLSSTRTIKELLEKRAAVRFLKE